MHGRLVATAWLAPNIVRVVLDGDELTSSRGVHVLAFTGPSGACKPALDPARSRSAVPNPTGTHPHAPGTPGGIH